MTTSNALPLSVIVIAYNMAREIPRTVLSLSSRLQRDIGEDDYEIIIIDNGSTDGFDYPGLAQLGGNIVVHTVRDASPSPVAAVNHGLSIARGELIGVFIDGARIASPRLLATAREAAVGQAHPVIGTLAFHLGPDVQYRSVEHGYDQAAEDRLLASIDWPAAPYRLYEIAVFAGSSAAGWFTLPAESNALFLPRAQWQALGGYDTHFTTPGGGLVNLDTWYRACTAPEAVPILLLGEGTFHQVHGGVATNATDKWPLFHAEYRRLRGHDYRKPEIRPRLFGQFPPEAEHSIAVSVGAGETNQSASLPATRERSIVIVAGGHRTGTSATAGLLALLGLDAGDNLQAGDGHNAKGYFEDRQVVAIHDRLLGALRSSWDDPFPLPEGWPESPPAARAAEELQSVIDGLTASGSIAVTKDPRACRFLPLWLDTCKKEDLTPLFVIPVRSPEASVASLVKRNRFPIEHAALLWLTHLRDAEKFSRGHRRAFVHYESMLDDWQAELRRIDRTLGLAIDWNEALIRQGYDFISTELNHGDQPLPAEDSPALELAGSIHRELRQCVPGDDPGWIFERAGREIDRLAHSHLKAAASSPSAPPSTSSAPTATTASPAGKIPPPVLIQPRLLADQQQRATALKRMADGDLIGGAEILIALAAAGTGVAEVYYDLGMLALQQSDRVAASELFSTAIAKSGHPSASTLALARLEKDEGHFERALATLSPYLRAGDNDGEALALVREILAAGGELSAIAWARLVTDLRSTAKPETQQP